jgi:type 1 glutamine amidotransferase
MKRLFFLLVASSVVAAELTDEQRRLPLEVEAPDASLAKVVILAGAQSAGSKSGGHEYFAGGALIAGWLKQTPGVWPVLVSGGWPTDERVFQGARAVVVYSDGGLKLPFLNPERWAKMRDLVEHGVGVTMLHQTIDIPEAQAEELKSWVGGAWTKDIGERGHWDMEFSELPKHPILNGVQPFAAPMDGWLYNLHFADSITPLLSGTVPDKTRNTPDARAHLGRAETVAWAYTRPKGGRSFVFTGCHEHKYWRLESQRRFVVNGVLWTAKLDVPSSGAVVEMDPAELGRNLDDKSKPAPKVE